MTETASTPAPLVQEILTGDNRELKRLAASGIVPLPPEDLIELQVHLAQIDDEEIASQAQESLAAADPGTLQSFVRHTAKCPPGRGLPVQAFAGDYG